MPSLAHNSSVLSESLIKVSPAEPPPRWLSLTTHVLQSVPSGRSHVQHSHPSYLAIKAQMEPCSLDDVWKHVLLLVPLCTANMVQCPRSHIVLSCHHMQNASKLTERSQRRLSCLSFDSDDIQIESRVADRGPGRRIHIHHGRQRLAMSLSSVLERLQVSPLGSWRTSTCSCDCS